MFFLPILSSFFMGLTFTTKRFFSQKKNFFSYKKFFFSYKKIIDGKIHHRFHWSTCTELTLYYLHFESIWWQFFVWFANKKAYTFIVIWYWMRLWRMKTHLKTTIKESNVNKGHWESTQFFSDDFYLKRHKN